MDSMDMPFIAIVDTDVTTSIGEYNNSLGIAVLNTRVYSSTYRYWVGMAIDTGIAIVDIVLQ